MILRLLAELDSAESNPEHLNTLEEVKPTDKVLGTVGPRVAKLVSIIQRAHEFNASEAEKLKLQMLEPSNTLGTIRAGIRSIAERKRQIDLLAQIYSLEVYQEFSTEDGERQNLQLRKGGIVVNEETPPATASQRPKMTIIEVVMSGEHDCGDPNCEACSQIYRQQPSEEEPTAPPEPEDETADSPLQPEAKEFAPGLYPEPKID